MNSKSLLIWQLLLFFLLISQTYRFAKADYDDDEDKDDNDENNLFAERYDLPSDPDDEALRAIRDYIDLLCIRWNGFYQKLPNNPKVLRIYLRQVSLAYARVLHYYQNDHEVISRTINEQFMRHIVPRMRDVIRFNEDSPIRNGPAVVEYNLETKQIETNHVQRRDRWSNPPLILRQPRDAIVSRGELGWLIYLRVPYTELNDQRDRPPKPFERKWQKHTDPDQDLWPGLHLDRHFSYNHFVPFAELNWLLQMYNELWVDNNDGNLWYSDVFLLNLEIRLARMAILLADLSMNVPGTRSLLSNVRQYISRARSHVAWASGNLFIGPRDGARRPRPSKYGPGKFETYAAEVLRSKEWAEEGRRLTRDIINYQKRPRHRQYLSDIIEFLSRYLSLLHASGSAELWDEADQAVPQVSPSQYDISVNPVYWEIRQDIERRVSADVEHRERTRLIEQEFYRLRDEGYSEPDIYSTIDEELKPHGKLKDKLDAIYRKKLNDGIKKELEDQEIYENIYWGPKHSLEWTDLQKTMYCLLGKMKIKRKICGQNVLFGEPSTSSQGTSSSGSPEEVFVVGSNDDADDSGFSSGTSSRKPSDGDTCGIALEQVNLYFDPANVLSNPHPDVSAWRAVDDEYRQDAIASMQNDVVHECHRRRNVTDLYQHPRGKREIPECSWKVVNEFWKKCEHLIKV